MKPKGPPPPPPSKQAKYIALVVAIGCIALQFGRRLDLAAISAVLWLITVALADRFALRRLFMPKFWGITILFALASGFLLGPRDLDVLGLRFSAQGLEAGALMVCRGLFIFALVSWASRAIDGGVVSRLAGKVGLGNLGVAVGAAFGLLPALRDRLVERRLAMKGKGRPKLGELRRILVEVISETVRLSERLSRDLGERAALVVVSGSRGKGKTTAVTKLAHGLREKGLAIGGVIQPPIEGESGRVGYDLKDVATDEQLPFARRKKEGRGYDFDDAGWKWAAERLGAAQLDQDVVIVDELGLLEAEDGGHLITLRDLSERPGRAKLLIAAVRESCLEPITAKLGQPALVLEAPLDDEDVTKTLGEIERIVNA